MEQDFEEFIKRLKELDSEFQALKEYAMIYQAGLKEELALKHGKPVDAYYNLPYVEWAEIRDKEDV